MADPIKTLFDDFDRGRISRRHLLQMLGVAAVAAPLSKAFPQGQCGGDRATQPQCSKNVVPDPFAATGWKTVYFDHFKLHCADAPVEAAYYTALMGWKVRSNDGNVIVMDIGDT